MVNVRLLPVSVAAARAASASEARDAAIREAHAEGESLRAIAAAAGLSHQRVHQLVQGEHAQTR